jgi:hypothetical protein
MAQTPTSPPSGPDLGATLIPLLRGLVDRTAEPRRWHDLLVLQAQVRDQLRILGLELVLDESQGYAYARQRPAMDGESELPRLVPRRQLSYPVSLLLALLRRRMAEHDATSGERLILTRAEIAELLRVFLPDTADEQRYLRRLDALLVQIDGLGFIRTLRERSGGYEIRRILAAFVDAQWLQEFAGRLESYRRHAADGEDDGAVGAPGAEREAE